MDEGHGMIALFVLVVIAVLVAGLVAGWLDSGSSS